MVSMIKLGVATMALAITSTARPCDVARWDFSADGPREGACPTIVDYQAPEATDYDVSSYQLAARSNEEAAGSGSGEPEATDPPSSQASEDELLTALWTAP